MVVQCVFAVTISIEYVLEVQVQGWFRHEFHVDRHGRIPFHNSILKWVKVFRILAVSVIILLIDMISIHARECWQGSDQNFNSFSDRSVHCILHDDLKQL
jgi:short subunit fatty acids transporter